MNNSRAVAIQVSHDTFFDEKYIELANSFKTKHVIYWSKTCSTVKEEVEIGIPNLKLVSEWFRRIGKSCTQLVIIICENFPNSIEPVYFPAPLKIVIFRDTINLGCLTKIKSTKSNVAIMDNNQVKTPIIHVKASFFRIILTRMKSGVKFNEFYLSEIIILWLSIHTSTPVDKDFDEWYKKEYNSEVNFFTNYIKSLIDAIMDNAIKKINLCKDSVLEKLHNRDEKYKVDFAILTSENNIYNTSRRLVCLLESFIKNPEKMNVPFSWLKTIIEQEPVDIQFEEKAVYTFNSENLTGKKFFLIKKTSINITSKICLSYPFVVMLHLFDFDASTIVIPTINDHESFDIPFYLSSDPDALDYNDRLVSKILFGFDKDYCPSQKGFFTTIFLINVLKCDFSELNQEIYDLLKNLLNVVKIPILMPYCVNKFIEVPLSSSIWMYSIESPMIQLKMFEYFHPMYLNTMCEIMGIENIDIGNIGIQIFKTLVQDNRIDKNDILSIVEKAIVIFPRYEKTIILEKKVIKEKNGFVFIVSKKQNVPKENVYRYNEFGSCFLEFLVCSSTCKEYSDYIKSVLSTLNIPTFVEKFKPCICKDDSAIRAQAECYDSHLDIICKKHLTQTQSCLKFPTLTSRQCCNNLYGVLKVDHCYPTLDLKAKYCILKNYTEFQTVEFCYNAFGYCVNGVDMIRGAYRFFSRIYSPDSECTAFIKCGVKRRNSEVDETKKHKIIQLS